MPEFTNDLTHDDLALLLLLAEKRSLTRSAMTLAWSTPKASHRLNHARALIGDELFVRSGNSLVPTKRGGLGADHAPCAGSARRDFR